MCREWEKRSDVKCLNCGVYSIMHAAARALDELSAAGRAVVAESVRAQLTLLRKESPVPLIVESDVKEGAGRSA